jgi:hypothetical protein
MGNREQFIEGRHAEVCGGMRRKNITKEFASNLKIG